MAAAEEKNLMGEKELQQPEERQDAATVAPPTEPGRQQLFDLVVDTFLTKMEEAGSYQSFASCYSRLYKAQPELTKCIYDQFICRLTTSFREEVEELKQEGNLEVLFGTLDELEEGAKERNTPAWRPSGIPEEDLRSALLPYVLKQRAFLQKTLKEKEEENARLTETVLAGRKRISELQEEIQKRKAEWQVIALEGRELVDMFSEFQ